MAIQTAACVVGAPCSYRTLAWVQTLCGILAIVLTYVIARRLIGETAALLAAALVTTSPIQLGMGRRALEDMLFLVAFLIAFWATIRLAAPSSGRRALALYGVAFAAFTFGFGVKEIFAMYYPALVLLLVALRHSARPRLGDVLAFCLAPLAFAAIFGVLSGNVGLLADFIQVWRAGVVNGYVLQYQSGPPVEPFVDLFILAPIVTTLGILAAVAIGVRRRASDRGASALMLATVMLFVAYALIPKDARYYLAADTTLRMLAAWLVVAAVPVARLAPASAVLLAANGTLEIAIFVIVFVRGAVYDPVLAGILRALGAIAR